MSYPGSRPYWYALLPADRVRPGHLLPLADVLAAAATLDLALRTPVAIRWFTQCDHPPRREPVGAGASAPLTPEECAELLLNMGAPPRLSGCYLAMSPGVIYLRAARSPHALALALLHQVRHVWQHEKGKVPTNVTRNAFEAQADADAEAYAGRTYRKLSPLIRKYDRMAQEA